MLHTDTVTDSYRFLLYRYRVSVLVSVYRLIPGIGQTLRAVTGVRMRALLNENPHRNAFSPVRPSSPKLEKCPNW